MVTMKTIFYCPKCKYETKPQRHMASAEMGHQCPTPKGRQWKPLMRREIEQ